MRRRFAVAAALALVVGLAGAPFAVGQVDGAGGDTTVTATVLAGTRSVALPTPVVLAGLQGADTLQGTYVVQVVEAVRSGTNPWSLEASITNLERDGGPEVIEDTDILLVSRDVTVVGLVKVPLTAPSGVKDGTLADEPEDATFGDDQILFRIVGQDPAAAYTATYTGTGSLEVDVSSVPAGTYEGTITYTLFQ